MGLFNLFKPARTVLVVDTVSLNESLGMKGNVAPRNQLQLLRRLSRFAEREKTPIVAVLCGEELNKAPHGKKFEDHVTVVYSKSPEDHAKFLARTVSSQGSGAVLVTGSAAVEKMVPGSTRKLRTATFRKAFDVGPDGEGDERGGGQGRGNRPPRRRQQQQQQQKPPRNDDEGGRERPEREMSDADAINELIDLVD